jgi:hypothetical protein
MITEKAAAQTYHSGLCRGPDQRPHRLLLALYLSEVSPRRRALDRLNLLARVSDQILGLERVFALRNSMNIAAVNMSLGGHQGAHDGTRPDEMMVDHLSGNPGFAFVTSAGNSGPGDATVTSPASAEDAISVAASTATFA